MKAAYRQALIERINRKDWWHVPPAGPKSYEIRGKFYASTYRESEFWGHPNDTPERVRIQNPVIGDEGTVWRILFGKCVKYPGDKYPRLLEWRWALDAKMKKAAIRKGYDAIVILSTQGYRKLRSLGNVPLSIELNVLTSSGSVIP